MFIEPVNFRENVLSLKDSDAENSDASNYVSTGIRWGTSVDKFERYGDYSIENPPLWPQLLARRPKGYFLEMGGASVEAARKKQLDEQKLWRVSEGFVFSVVTLGVSLCAGAISPPLGAVLFAKGAALSLGSAAAVGVASGTVQAHREGIPYDEQILFLNTLDEMSEMLRTGDAPSWVDNPREVYRRRKISPTVFDLARNELHLAGRLTGRLDHMSACLRQIYHWPTESGPAQQRVLDWASNIPQLRLPPVNCTHKELTAWRMGSLRDPAPQHVTRVGFML